MGGSDEIKWRKNSFKRLPSSPLLELGDDILARVLGFLGGRDDKPQSDGGTIVGLLWVWSCLRDFFSRNYLGVLMRTCSA